MRQDESERVVIVRVRDNRPDWLALALLVLGLLTAYWARATGGWVGHLPSLACVLLAAVRSDGPRRLRLGDDGFELRGWGVGRFCSWAQVVSVGRNADSVYVRVERSALRVCARRRR